jgi:hypothetical protein
MGEAEAKQFESDHLHPLFIKIREWDDKAKMQDVPLPSLEVYKQMSIQHLLAQN